MNHHEEHEFMDMFVYGQILLFTHVYGQILTRQTPFGSKCIELQSVRLFSMFSENQGRMRVEKCPICPQKVFLEPPLLDIFFQKVHHPMRNEKLRTVPGFGDPNINLE